MVGKYFKCYLVFQLVSLVSWSPCGNYIASASINGEIFIWKMATQAVIERFGKQIIGVCGKMLQVTYWGWTQKLFFQIALSFLGQLEENLMLSRVTC